jgi:hypothetical protein
MIRTPAPVWMTAAHSAGPWQILDPMAFDASKLAIDAAS